MSEFDLGWEQGVWDASVGLDCRFSFGDSLFSHGYRVGYHYFKELLKRVVL